MDPNRPLHNDQLLAELAALDELLRKPVEPDELEESARRVEAARRAESATRGEFGAGVEAARPPQPAPVPDAVSTTPPERAWSPRDLWRSRAPVPTVEPPSQPSPTPVVSRKPSVTSRRILSSGGPLLSSALPSSSQEIVRSQELQRARERDLDVYAPDMEAPRVSGRRSYVGALWGAALSIGLLGGGLLGWWHAAHTVVEPPSAEPEIHAPIAPAAAPSDASRSSRGARGTALPRSAAASGVEASNATPLSFAPPPVVAPPAAAVSDDAAATIVAQLPTAPAPSPLSAPPLPSAPLPVTPSAAPASPLALAAAGALAAAVAADEAAIKTTLRQYESAYERLDAKAASAVWPTVDERALSHAFAGLTSQSLNLGGCDVAVRAGASTATASCNGTAEYVRKVGDTRVRVEARQWTFTLNKTQGAWRIEAVDASR